MAKSRRRPAAPAAHSVAVGAVDKNKLILSGAQLQTLEAHIPQWLKAACPLRPGVGWAKETKSEAAPLLLLERRLAAKAPKPKHTIEGSQDGAQILGRQSGVCGASVPAMEATLTGVAWGSKWQRHLASCNRGASCCAAVAHAVHHWRL